MTRESLIDCLPYLTGILLSVGVLRLLVACSGARWITTAAAGGRQAGDVQGQGTTTSSLSLRRLHRDETGAVQSLSFVLTLPLFVMVMLFIVQLSQITIGRLAVEYAAMAAARSAVVWIPANLGDDFETENRIGGYVDLGDAIDDEGQTYRRYRVEEGSPKFEKVRLAAAMALMSICPSRDVGARRYPIESLERAYRAISPTAAANSRVPDRLRNKFGYAMDNTSVLIEFHHKDTEPPLIMHFISSRREEFAYNEIGWQDQILVTVTHNFSLLPGPGRLLARRTPVRDSNGDVVSGDPVADRVERRRGTYVYTLNATLRLNNEGEKPLVPYIQPPIPLPDEVRGQ
jgi:hypothetical protein